MTTAGRPSLSIHSNKNLFMIKKTICQCILAAGISLALFSCNNKEKKAEPATSDSTAPVTADTTHQAAKNTVGDGVTVAPNLYKVIADSLGLRVVEATYKPGDSSALHSHPDYVVYAADGGTATFYDKDGAKMVAPMKSGMMLVKAAELHSVKNTGKTTLKVILVEVNRPNTIVSQDAAMDATKVAPGLYKLDKDTMGIRAIEVNYKPGQSSPMHAHPDVVLYVTEPGTGEFTDKDGKKSTAEFKKGTVLIRGPESHSVKNTGKTTLKAIMVEVNRPRN
jgi:oxalate decarboxylase/phosphoglucose isomerase-like protein (cupin superfamily)